MTQNQSTQCSVYSTLYTVQRMYHCTTTSLCPLQLRKLWIDTETQHTVLCTQCSLCLCIQCSVCSHRDKALPENAPLYHYVSVPSVLTRKQGKQYSVHSALYAVLCIQCRECTTVPLRLCAPLQLRKLDDSDFKDRHGTGAYIRVSQQYTAGGWLVPP